MVKNPAFGTPGGGPAALEVPWRDGTAVRTARRQDLLLLLSPLATLPTFEVLTAQLIVDSVPALGRPGECQLQWDLEARLYAESPMDLPLVMPIHRASAVVLLPSTRGPIVLDYLRFWTPQASRRDGSAVGSLSLTIDSAPDQLLIRGPGMVTLAARGSTTVFHFDPDELSNAKITLAFVQAETPVTIEFTLSPSVRRADEIASWQYPSSSN